jgi:ferrous iron transport protein B
MLAAISPGSVISLLVFCLLYTPCVAAIAAIRRELGGKWAGGIVAFQCGIAWVVAFIVHAICLACGLA